MKLKAILGVFIILGIYCVADAAEFTNIWPNLSSINVDKTEVGTVNFYYNPQVTEIINQKVDADGPKTIQVARIRLAPGYSSVYYVEYDEGPSADPRFRIYRGLNDNGVEVFNEFGLNLIAPGNGFIYITGHTNNVFYQRKKYEYANGKFCEVVQPYYYVGVSSVTREPIVLYADQKQKNIVAKLPKGAKVDVIINDKDFYLIKTEFGLVGWVNLTIGGGQTSIENIFYAGD